MMLLDSSLPASEYLHSGTIGEGHRHRFEPEIQSALRPRCNPAGGINERAPGLFIIHQTALIFPAKRSPAGSGFARRSSGPFSPPASPAGLTLACLSFLFDNSAPFG